MELDQLWMPKCLRVGWCINFSPTPFEQGVWKRHYIQTVQELRLTALQVRRSDPELAQCSNSPQDFALKYPVQSHIKTSTVHLQTAPSQQQFAVPRVSAISSRHEDPSEVAFLSVEDPASTTQRLGSISRTGLRKEKQPTAPLPWRDSDRRPKDTLRFNYLDNLDPSEQALEA